VSHRHRQAAAGDRPSGRVHSGTPRPVRPTAAVRCAKVRSASRPADHSESGWSDNVSADVERTPDSTSSSENLTQRSEASDQGSLGPVASSTSDATSGTRVACSRSVQQGNHRVGEEFLYELKAGPAGGRLRRPSSRRQRRDGYRRADRALARLAIASPHGQPSRITWFESNIWPPVSSYSTTAKRSTEESAGT
jgi:hypothetical protein